MRKQNLDFEKYKKEVFLKDPAVKAEYDKLQPEFAVIRAILEARMKRNITQKELAKRMETKQSAISRLESGTANPSINFLKKLADALNSRLEIRLLPK